MNVVKLSAEEIASQLCVFLRDNVLAPQIEVTSDTALSEVGVDSFSLMELVLFIERQFALELPAEALTPENIASVGTLSTYCVAQLNSAAV